MDFLFYGSWLSSGGTSVTTSENTITSRRTGSVTYTQHERGTTIPVSVGQDPAVISTGYQFSMSPNDWMMHRPSQGDSIYVEVTSLKQKRINNTVVESTFVDWGVYSDNGVGNGSSVRLTNASNNTYVDISKIDGNAAMAKLSVYAGSDYPLIEGKSCIFKQKEGGDRMMKFSVYMSL